MNIGPFYQNTHNQDAIQLTCSQHQLHGLHFTLSQQLSEPGLQLQISEPESLLQYQLMGPQPQQAWNPPLPIGPRPESAWLLPDPAGP